MDVIMGRIYPTTREQLTKEVVGLKRVMDEVLTACEANLQGTKPLETEVKKLRAEMRARFDGLDDRLMVVEDRRDQ
jgi:hypothetical protein